jgi:phosphorylcholine metabolism protein LicD
MKQYILILIVLIILFYFLKLNKKENYEGMKYSSKLSNEDIDNIKKGQSKMSFMLKEFDRICRKYDVKYFLIGGSLIGALAYKGWIPWDGDVDLEVCEDDYDKLKNVIQNELPNDIWFQDTSTDMFYHHRIASKLRHLNTCYIDYPYGGKKSHQGLQIDINIYKQIGNKIYFPDNKKVTYLTYKDIYPLKRVPFEDFHVYVMNNSEKYLINNYGKFWYKDLPVEKRFPHEGRMDPNKTCEFHFNLYPNLYK